MSKLFNALYRQLINLYPSSFRAEFGEEMKDVFSQALSSQKNFRQQAAFFLREVFDLPGALLRQNLASLFNNRGVPMMENYGSAQPSSRRDALLGTLPFLMYGLICILVKFALPTLEFYLWLAFYLITLPWLVIGWVKRFPRWSYAYLGWSMTLAWEWSGAPLVLLVPALVVAMVWTRSISPIKKLFLGILDDWTCLSFALFTLPASSILNYFWGDNPYVLFFMLGSTLAVSLGAYLYLRSTNAAYKIASLFGSLIAAFTLFFISENAWNIAGNYLQPPTTTINHLLILVILRWLISLVMMTVLLFGPAILSMFRFRKQQQSA